MWATTPAMQRTRFDCGELCHACRPAGGTARAVEPGSRDRRGRRPLNDPTTVPVAEARGRVVVERRDTESAGKSFVGPMGIAMEPDAALPPEFTPALGGSPELPRKPLFERGDPGDHGVATLTKPTESKRDGAASADNRRRQDRFSVELEVSLESEHNFYAGFVENLSSSGLFVATHSTRPIGSHVEFSISFGDSSVAVKGLGEVRWIRQYSETSDAHPGMGLRFIELSPEGARKIQEFLVGREPIFYDDDL